MFETQIQSRENHFEQAPEARNKDAFRLAFASSFILAALSLNETSIQISNGNPTGSFLAGSASIALTCLTSRLWRDRP